MWPVFPTVTFGAEPLFRSKHMSSLIDFSEALAAVVSAVGPSVVRVDGGRRQSSSGVVWAPGVVVATNHALAFREGNAVDFGDGTSRPATALGHDPSTDLAVLKVDTNLGTPAP